MKTIIHANPVYVLEVQKESSKKESSLQRYFV